ncbi:M24 family metallopeptidase [Dermatobacter hominis]|uniref:M24 family metallopeptidase n=1 Tax=Dermatobacter hominis TaxID=2884263 RepID=UPI001D10CB23|nr:Xaa-Pro peptidase family protein [Dermatobacter hominis]UDY36712.1 Xaa-Pro peptidase family protein [Dermatobacter hominis]
MPAGLMERAAPARLPSSPDLGRMRADRIAKVRANMQQAGLDAVVLLGNTNVVYATGATWPLGDPGRANFEQPVAVVLADDEWPHLFTPLPDDPGLPADHVHGPVYLDLDEGVQRFERQLAELVPAGASIGVDEWTFAMARESSLLFSDGTPRDGGKAITKAKAVKTPDELAGLREALRITEQAIAEVQAAIAPGMRQVEMTATFLRAVFDAGADANTLDPIWQVMPPTMGDGPWTTHGDLACPLLTTERELQRGDVLWVDTSITHRGFHSDFGRTWIVGADPTPRQRAQFELWSDIVRAVLDVTCAGAAQSELTAAARAVAGDRTPWMPHFYLGHGLGIDAAEMPYVGSDLGEQFDAGHALEAGMVLVLEPLVWDDGAAGYRAEEVVVITEDGWEPMTDYPYDPF